MIKTVALLSTLLFAHIAFGQVRHETNLKLDRLVQTALAMAEKVKPKTVWAGYSIHRQMYADSQFGWYSAEPDRQVLAEVLGSRTPEDADDLVPTARRTLDGLEKTLVSKEVGILLQVDRDRQAIVSIRLTSMDAPGRLGDDPILWVGARTDNESLELLEGLWSEVPENLQEDLVAAIGAHDAGERVMPWLMRIARSHGGRDAGEAARHWLASHLTVRMGLRPQTRVDRSPGEELRRSALYALVNAEEGRASELLVRLVTSSPDRGVRRAALIQLAHLDGREGEAGLFQFAERYLKTGG